MTTTPSPIEIFELPAGNKPFFTGNNAVPFVAVQAAAPAIPYLAVNGGTGALFARGDSALIIKGGIRLPYVYSLATLPLVVNLSWVGKDDSAVYPAGQICFPMDGIEIDFSGQNAGGIFLRGPFVTDQKYYLCAALVAGATVNQFYAPDSFNAADLEIDVWFKIQHTLPITAVS